MIGRDNPVACQEIARQILKAQFLALPLIYVPRKTE